MRLLSIVRGGVGCLAAERVGAGAGLGSFQEDAARQDQRTQGASRTRFTAHTVHTHRTCTALAAPDGAAPRGTALHCTNHTHNTGTPSAQSNIVDVIVNEEHNQARAAHLGVRFYFVLTFTIPPRLFVDSSSPWMHIGGFV